MKAKTIQFVLEGVTYNAKFPNVGNYLDIENTRMMLTNNSYADLLRSGLKASWFAVDLVDAISFMLVMVPNLRVDLNVKNYNDLDPFEAKKIVKVYKKQIKPWYEGLMDELLKDEEIEVPQPPDPKGDEPNSKE
jgi:hypothetical protein